MMMTMTVDDVAMMTDNLSVGSLSVSYHSHVTPLPKQLSDHEAVIAVDLVDPNSLSVVWDDIGGLDEEIAKVVYVAWSSGNVGCSRLPRGRSRRL
jgi:hypothetical protein